MNYRLSFKLPRSPWLGAATNILAFKTNFGCVGQSKRGLLEKETIRRIHFLATQPNGIPMHHHKTFRPCLLEVEIFPVSPIPTSLKGATMGPILLLFQQASLPRALSSLMLSSWLASSRTALSSLGCIFHA